MQKRQEFSVPLVFESRVCSMKQMQQFKYKSPLQAVRSVLPAGHSLSFYAFIQFSIYTYVKSEM